MTVLDYRSVPLADPLERTNGHWLGWAIYLAMSWTWCIGMFLPVLLVRDYGVWAWVVFAVPNVVGAAAMGWVIATREQSRQIVLTHRPTMIVFSIVTAAFQLFFAAWFISELLNTAIGVQGAVILLVAVAAAAIFLRGPRLAPVLMAALVLVLSIGCCWKLARSDYLTLPGVLSRPSIDVLWLLPVSLFGFLLCPYLDLTFHHARSQMSRPQSQLAFGIGFGIIFLGSIAFALSYAFGLLYLWDLKAVIAVTTFSVYFSIHVIFTTALHWERATREFGHTQIMSTLLAVAVASAVLALLAWMIGGAVGGELVYRAFVGFYALVFPTYVWLCMIPSPRSQPSRRALIVFTVSVLVAAPMFWMGFIMGRMIWLLPGLAIVLLARLAVKRTAVIPGTVGADGAVSRAAPDVGGL